MVRMKVVAGVAGRQEIAGGQEWQAGKKHKKERQAGVRGEESRGRGPGHIIRYAVLRRPLLKCFTRGGGGGRLISIQFLTFLHDKYVLAHPPPPLPPAGSIPCTMFSVVLLSMENQMPDVVTCCQGVGVGSGQGKR